MEFLTRVNYIVSKDVPFEGQGLRYLECFNNFSLSEIVSFNSNNRVTSCKTTSYAKAYRKRLVSINSTPEEKARLNLVLIERLNRNKIDVVLHLVGSTSTAA